MSIINLLEFIGGFMRKLSLYLSLLFFVCYLSVGTFAQSSEGQHVVHVQAFKLKSIPTGDAAKEFSEMLNRQSSVINSDPRVVSTRVVRHYWGNDSRDFVMIMEFKNTKDLFSFYDDMNSLM